MATKKATSKSTKQEAPVNQITNQAMFVAKVDRKWIGKGFASVTILQELQEPHLEFVTSHRIQLLAKASNTVSMVKRLEEGVLYQFTCYYAAPKVTKAAYNKIEAKINTLKSQKAKDAAWSLFWNLDAKKWHGFVICSIKEV